MVFETVAFRFIQKSDPVSSRWVHWSRMYEWTMILEKVHALAPSSLHNTACGGLDRGDCLHLSFCRELDSLCKGSIHSDIWGSNWIVEEKPAARNFITYDICEPLRLHKFDLVLCISALEHLPKPKQHKAFHNLLEQVKPGGRLIMTMDWPEANVRWFETLVQKELMHTAEDITGPRGIKVAYLEFMKS